MAIKASLFEYVITMIEKIIPLSLEFKKSLSEIMFDEYLEMGNYILNQAEPKLKHWLIVEGCIREYFVERNSEIQYTQWFWYKNDFICSMPGSFVQLPADYYIEILEKTHLIYISYKDFALLKAKFPEAEHFAEFVRQQYLNRVFHHVNQLRQWKAKEKYHHLFTEKPQLFLLSKQRDIASFLGIRPDTLSKLKKNSL